MSPVEFLAPSDVYSVILYQALRQAVWNNEDNRLY
jgi:hypothetical protein